MWEMQEVDAATVTLGSDGVIQLQGADGVVRTYRRTALSYADPMNIVVPRNTWEVWDFLNIGGPPHPMHVHMVRFQALGRDVYDTGGFDLRKRGTTRPITFLKAGALEVGETGWKDVVRVAAGLERQGELVTIAAQFGRQTGRYVYHCHLLEHEHGMMRPFVVQPAEVIALSGEHGMGHQHG
jgi:spore coat protein A